MHVISDYVRIIGININGARIFTVNIGKKSVTRGVIAGVKMMTYISLSASLIR